MSGFSSDDGYEGDDPGTAAGGNTVASLQAGHPFSLLLSEDREERAGLLEVTLDTVADTATRFVRATNPLRARLTLERLLLQVIQGPIDLETESGPELIRRIAERRGDETRVILVIEQAETLHPEVLRFFGDTAAVFPDEIPRLQVLFAGRPEFRAMLDDPDAGLDEQTAQLEAYRPVASDPAYAPLAEVPMSEPIRPYQAPVPGLMDQFQETWDAGWGAKIGIVGGVGGGVLAVAFAVYLAVSTSEPPVVLDTGGTALLEMPEPPQSDPDPPVLLPGPPRDEATAVLRSEFDSYLLASGRDLQNATQAQKRTTYQEFLVWRARTMPGKGS